jgi:hypothetical protein
MCIFTGSVRDVRSTKIYGRIQGVEQLLAYAMHMDADAELAMVLPLPIAPGTGEHDVRFIDLSGYAARIFDELDKLFPSALGITGWGAPPPTPGSLTVHEVGSFVASYVPSMDDFVRLDRRFRLSDDVWSALPQFADHGFAVFQLAAGKKEVHPMGLAFPTRDPSRVYFPCVHVHDGTVRDTAAFDHVLYCQRPSVPEGWETSAWPPAAGTIAHSRGVLDDSLVHRRNLSGELPNQDVYA